MKSLKNTGFTIVETMIFLAVSGVIFASVSLLITGQLNKYQSRDSMNQLESSVRGVLNDVTNGYYPIANNNYSCSGAIDNSINRGENQNCVFAGKSVRFDSSEVIISTYVTPSTTTTITNTSSLRNITGLEERKEYKWKITPTTASLGTTYYVLNTILSTNITGQFVSGAQNVVLYKADGSGNLTVVDGAGRNNFVCYENGEQTSSLEFLIGGKLGVRANFNDSSC